MRYKCNKITQNIFLSTLFPITLFAIKCDQSINLRTNPTNKRIKLVLQSMFEEENTLLSNRFHIILHESCLNSVLC